MRKIFVDDGGLGGAITDVLIEKLGRKVIGINNSSKRVKVEGEERKKGILKEDLYNNTLLMLERGDLSLPQDPFLMKSLKSIQYDYTSNERVKIWGGYSHITEALVRACWAVFEKGHKLYIY